MNDAKYIGLDVHQATISAAVLGSTGKLVMANSLCRAEERRTMHKPEVQIGNSGLVLADLCHHSN